MPGNCSMENASSSATALQSPGQNKALNWHWSLLSVSQVTTLTRGDLQETLHSQESHQQLLHFSSQLTSQPNTAPALQLPLSFVSFRAGPSSGHWPDLLLSTSSPALAVQVTKSLLASTLSLASVILQMFLVYPSYLYHLPYSRQETELYPLS